MDVLLRKSPFCPELTQILDLEETETRDSATLEIANLALLTLWMEFENTFI